MTLVDQVEGHVAACRSTGLSITGPVEAFHQVVPALTPDEVNGQWPIIVLAVKAQATEAALEQLKPHLASDGYVLSAQNGLNEITIAQSVGPSGRWAASSISARTGWDRVRSCLATVPLVVGEIDGSMRERTRAMHERLTIFEPQAVLTDNIWAILWGKLAYGAMLFATALTTDSMTANFADPRRFPVFDALGREVMAVAKARGVKPIGFNASTRRSLRPERRRRGRAPPSRLSPSSTAIRPRRIRASTATSRCASARPRSIRRSA